MRMCWADRVGIAWGVIIFLILTAMWAGPNSSIADMPAAGWLDMIYLIAPIWIVFRLIDFVIGGPARRRGQMHVTIQR